MRQPARTDRPWMPDYGLANDAAGLLPWSWAVDHLESARRFWVATADPTGQPNLSAVWAVWFEDALWFSCGPRSRKARNLLADSRCSVATERADEAVTLTGRARRVEGAPELSGVTEAYVVKYGEGFPDPAVNPLFTVLPESVIGIVEDDVPNRATRWSFSSTGAAAY